MQKQAHTEIVRQGECARPTVCPLSRVTAGTVVCIKELATSSDIRERLREMGLYEEQQIKLLRKDGNLICQVCNARLGLSAELADGILVEPVPHRLKVA